MKRSLATIVNFSTNEALFLPQCLEEMRHFSDQIIVSVCDHFFDGTCENTALLNSIYLTHPDVQFIQYEWSRDNFYGRHSPHFWHNLSRLIGTYFLKDEIEIVAFLDVDEIIEGERFAAWLKQFPIQDYVALRLASHWYFREARFRAQEVEDPLLITSRKALHYDALMHQFERAGTFYCLDGKKERFVAKADPLLHHYSWVRSKEGLLRKVRSWGHRDERNWEDLIEEEFANPFSGKDFVHGYDFIEVEPYLKPAEYAWKDGVPGNVTYLKTRDIHKIDLALKFEIL